MHVAKLSKIGQMRVIWLTLLASIATLSPAHAARLLGTDQYWIWIEYDDGSIIGYNKSVVVLFLLLVIGLLVAWLMSAARTAARQSYIVSENCTQYYQVEADRLRSLKRQLDEEAAYFETYIRIMRAEAEVTELPEIIEHERVKRELRGRINNG